MDTLTPKQLAFADLERELTLTRPVLERITPAHFDFKPHEKSMTLLALALHVTDLPGWIRGTIAEDGMDAATMPPPEKTVPDTAALLARWDKNAAAARAAVAAFDMSKFTAPWTMRNGEQIIVSRPRHIVYRIWCLNHLIHHRAQLNVYLRLLNLPVPTLYFNSADDPTWIFE